MFENKNVPKHSSTLNQHDPTRYFTNKIPWKKLIKRWIQHSTDSLHNNWIEKISHMLVCEHPIATTIKCKPNFNCNYHFPTDLTPIGIPIGAIIYQIMVITIQIWSDSGRSRKYSTLLTLRLHTEKSFRNLIKSNRNQIVFTMHRLILTQKGIRLDPNQSENRKYNLISVWFKTISKRFFCVQKCERECIVNVNAHIKESYKVKSLWISWGSLTVIRPHASVMINLTTAASAREAKSTGIIVEGN